MGALAGFGMGAVGGGLGSLRKTGRPETAGIESLLAENRQILGVPPAGPEGGAGVTPTAPVAPAAPSAPSSLAVINPITGETVEPTDPSYPDVVKLKGDAATVEQRAAAEAIEQQNQPPSTELIQQTADESQDIAQMMGELEGKPVEPTVQVPAAPVVTGGPSAPVQKAKPEITRTNTEDGGVNTLVKRDGEVIKDVTRYRYSAIVDGEPVKFVVEVDNKTGQTIAQYEVEGRPVGDLGIGELVKGGMSREDAIKSVLPSIESMELVKPEAPETTAGPATPTGGPAAPVVEKAPEEPVEEAAVI